MIAIRKSTVIDAPLDEVWRVLRDFNSHALWHPAVAASVIEGDEPADRVGCVRSFRLRDGGELREQLLALSEQSHGFTYRIVDSTIPLLRYVATVALKRVTDGNRTFWDWRSSFDTPPGQEATLAELVGKDVYEAGFAGLRAFLKRGGASRLHAAQAPQGASTAHMALAGDASVMRSHGGPEVLRLERVEAQPPARGEVRIRQSAIGVNYIDVYVRSGEYRMLTPPGTPGMEAAGVIVDVGKGVTHLLPGDRVAYACPPVGGYASVRTLAADQVVLLPASIGEETAAALLLKGLSAEYLLHRTAQVQRGDLVLVHAAAGGVGSLLCQWAKHLGATVIGTVSTDDKARSAREAGCDYPIVCGREDFAERVLAISDGKGADVIYDGIGRSSFAGSLRALATCGHLVCYGHASGANAAIEPSLLAAKSATVSVPVLFDYTSQPTVLREMARRLFDTVERGLLRVAIKHRYPLGAAAEAHRDLEARRTTGSIILLA
jgi:NADPH2:quinone reductase